MEYKNIDWRARGDLCSKCSPSYSCPQIHACPLKETHECSYFKSMTHEDWKIYFKIILEREKRQEPVQKVGLENVVHITYNNRLQLNIGNITLNKGFLPYSLVHNTSIDFLQFLYWYILKVSPFDVKYGNIQILLEDMEDLGSANRCDKTIKIQNKHFYNDKCTYVIKTLAHELVHHEQYVSGKLKWDNCKVWKNKKFENWIEIPHKERPWEIEAYARAEILTNEFYSQLRSGRYVPKRKS